MSALSQPRGASPFGRGAVLGVLLVGFTAFIAMLYFIGAGDTGGGARGGAAHAAANGINGYSALAKLLDAEGYEVERSRSAKGFDTSGLLILTPAQFTDPMEIGKILQDREYVGPTLLIMPKWQTGTPGGNVVEEDADRMQNDWVSLVAANPAHWAEELPAPFTFTHKMEAMKRDESPYFEGLGLSGELPTSAVLYAKDRSAHETLIADAAGHALAINVVGEEGTDYYENAHWTIIVAEPDLMNNYGLADPKRAAAALALVKEAGYGDATAVTFDMTLNGFGNSVNLLTLAFQPPFLAATLCLILAMAIVGWRAFMRFGPAAVGTQDIAFGKRRLVNNGAGLIVRARRLGLLAAPYCHLMERRLGRALGLARPDAEAIDNALAVRLPDHEPFSSMAARLRGAQKPADILRAAQAMNDVINTLGAKT